MKRQKIATLVLLGLLGLGIGAADRERPGGPDVRLTSSGGGQDAPRDDSYWSSDWCHYAMGADGAWHGESCLYSTDDPHLFNVYRYGTMQLTMQLYTGYSGFNTFRDVTSPDFNGIQWMSYPLTGEVTQENFFILPAGSTEFVSLARLNELVRSNTRAPARVPAWDPAITVQMNALFMNIRNTSRGNPPGQIGG